MIPGIRSHFLQKVKVIRSSTVSLTLHSATDKLPGKPKPLTVHVPIIGSLLRDI